MRQSSAGGTPPDTGRDAKHRARFGTAALILAAVLGGASTAVGFDDPAQAFFARHCLRCHDAGTQEGGLRLDTISTDFADGTVAGRWGDVRLRISAGEMPPADEPRPTAEEIDRIVTWISRRIEAGEADRMARRGPVAHYRLSREEYGHTAYDLLGVHLDVRLPGLFNEDAVWHGMERIGALLTLSPAHVERYVRAAAEVASLAFPAVPPQSETKRQSAPEGLRWLLPPGTSRRLATTPVPGRYRVRIRASGLPSFKGRLPHLGFWHGDLKQTVVGVDVGAAEGEPAIIEFETLLPKGAFSILNEGPGTFQLAGPGAHNGVPDTIRTMAEYAPPPQAARILHDDGRPLVPLLLIDWVEVEGPIVLDADVAKRQDLYPASEGDPAALAASLHRLAERAWRRPVDADEIARYVELVRQEVAAGETFRSAYQSAVTGLLSSKNFFYLEEGEADERRDRVTAFELASRLSYFLWSSMPDAELFAAARAGTLLEPAVLEAQVDRMLADPKFDRFLESFPRQWLQLHRVGMFPPDATLYPDYDTWLERSMRSESIEYFRAMFAGDRPLREFLDSEWTVLNPRLARHYGLAVPAAGGWQRVTTSGERQQRGGLLTQAAVLSLTSDGTRHRPVHRGVWVSEAVFARTPPPPPPNVEPLEATPADQPKATVRMQLAAHSTHATCAACHAKIDPLGFAFDNYDALGRWRDREQVAGGQGEDPPVDASGVLPDGRSFAGPADFKRLLAADEDRFATAFVETLATYALRRAMTVDDADEVGRIVAAAKREGYRLPAVIRTLAASDLLRKR